MHCWGGGAAQTASSGKADDRLVTKVNHFYNGIEVVVIHQGEQPSFEEELAQDVLEIITVFSARLYGSRSRKHRKLLDTLADTVPVPVPVPTELRP